MYKINSKYLSLHENMRWKATARTVWRKIKYDYINLDREIYTSSRFDL